MRVGQVGRYNVGQVDDFPPGSVRIVEVDGRSIGVFNVGGRLHALRNVCPHRGAPLCLGTVTGKMQASRPHEYEFVEEDTIIRCPWHGYEFQLKDGRSIVDPETLRVKRYRVQVESGDIVLYV
jgi:nitrite reductase (NADH) small subunit